MSTAVKRPPGFRSAMTGVRAAMASKSSMERATRASRAMASRCSTAFVDPPVAATVVIAFSIDARVTSDRGRTSPATSFIRVRPQARATSALRASVAGTSFAPSGDIPRNAMAVAIVFAVYCPPQAPAPGHARSSIMRSSRSAIRPAACAPTASKTSWMVRSRPSKRPGAMAPP